MTVLTLALTIGAVLLVLGLWGRARLAAAERQRVELEAFRLTLGVPADRFRILDVPLSQSVRQALRPSRRPPRFADIHRTPLSVTVTRRAGPM